MNILEIAANFVTTVAILFAGRNSVHTWWTGIIGCLLFGMLFYQSQLYADVTLQGFFVITSVIGWRLWAKTKSNSTFGPELNSRPITRTPLSALVIFVVLALVIGSSYALLLHKYTDAYAPAWDSLLLVTSVIAQFLLMNRKIETWIFWLIVNTIAVPLFLSRGLQLTAILYATYWLHAIFAFVKWRKAYNLQRHQS